MIVKCKKCKALISIDDDHECSVGEVMNKEAYKKLYTATNELMADVGLHGEIEINTLDDRVCKIMDSLFEIDGGAYDPVLHGHVDVNTRYMGDPTTVDE